MEPAARASAAVASIIGNDSDSDELDEGITASTASRNSQKDNVSSRRVTLTPVTASRRSNESAAPRPDSSG